MMAFILVVFLTLAACLRVNSQGEPLPPSLVELVTGSPITSFEDLQQLLVTDSVEMDSDGPLALGLQPNNTAPHRLPRSLIDIQVAQQAQCKVRTEVMEVTRSMLDRRNANFLLWPPCVEVQRCSGCCNTRNLQCVATVTSIRPLQVTKIQFVNKQPLYEKAVISVEDHVECRCKSSLSIMLPRTMARKPQSPPPPKAPMLKSHSKEDIYQHDALKQNQNFQLDDLEGLQGQTQKPSTRLGTSTESTPLGEQLPHGPETQQGGEEKETQGVEHLEHRHSGPRPDTGHGLSHRHRGKTMEEKLMSETQASPSRSMETRGPAVKELQPTLHQNMEKTHLHADQNSSSPAGTTDQRSQPEEQLRDSKLLGERGRVDDPTQQRKDEQKRAQLQEGRPHQQKNHQHEHHLHLLHQPSHATQKAAIEAPTTSPPSLRPSRRRSSSLQRRLHKNRNRISKAAMRAILM